MCNVKANPFGLAFLLTNVNVPIMMYLRITNVNVKRSEQMTEMQAEKMTSAEWELMRIVWTLDHAGSREVIEIIQRKREWSESTIKTLLGRLVKKNLLATTKEGRNFVYHATIAEQTAMNDTVNDLFTSLCNMKKGITIIELIKNSTLTKTDIESMQKVLEKKLSDAPDKVECDCVPGAAMNCK